MQLYFLNFYIISQVLVLNIYNLIENKYYILGICLEEPYAIILNLMRLRKPSEEEFWWNQL